MRGRILDILTNQPIPGVHIYYSPSNDVADIANMGTTNEGGEFNFDAGNSPSFMTSHVGYRPIMIDPGNYPDPIYLEPKTYALPEVTVTASRTPAKSSMTSLIVIALIAYALSQD